MKKFKKFKANKNIKKKAISPIIAFVLLLGFTVAMAAFISTWVIKETKKFPERIEKIGEECEDVTLSVADVCKVNEVTQCADIKYAEEIPGTSVNTLNIILKNKGLFTIHKIKIIFEDVYEDEVGEDISHEEDLIPGSETEITAPYCEYAEEDNEIAIVPSRIKTEEGEEREIICSNREIILIDRDIKPCE